MKKNWQSVLIGFTGLSTWWGARLGLLLGFTCGLPALVYGIAFILLAIMGGAIVGAINGIVLGIITLLLRNFSYNPSQYRNIMLIATIITTFGMSFMLFSSIGKFYSGMGRVDLVVVLLPSVLVTIAAGYQSQKLAAWYLQHEYSKKKKRYPDESHGEEYSDMHPSLSEALDDEENQQQNIHSGKDTGHH